MNMKKGNYQTATLYLGNKCNFNCKYCSESGSNNGDYGISAETLPYFKENFKKVVEEYPIRTVQFFGGEPMMYYDEMMEIAKYTKDVKSEIKFTMITNGSLLNMKRARELMDLDFGIAVSHDGPYQEIQRSTDFLKNNPEPFQFYLEHDKKNMMSFSSTLSYPNYDYLAVFDYFEKWKDKNKIGVLPRVMCEIAHGCLDRVDIRKENEDAYYDQWCKMLDQVMTNLVEGIRNNNFMTYEYRQYYPSIIRGLDILNNSEKAVLSCGQGTRRISLDHKGDVYSCHNVSLEKEYYRGNLFENNLKKWDYERYMRVHRCNECEVSSFCGCLCPLITQVEQQEMYCKYKKIEYIKLLAALNEVAPILLNNKEE